MQGKKVLEVFPGLQDISHRHICKAVNRLRVDLPSQFHVIIKGIFVEQPAANLL